MISSTTLIIHEYSIVRRTLPVNQTAVMIVDRQKKNHVHNVSGNTTGRIQ